MRSRLKHLSKGVAIYGAGDAAVLAVNFLLLPIYVKFGFLTTADFGALAAIGAVEAFAKVLARWGLDGAFMRYFHDRDRAGLLPRMTSTIVWFMLVLNGLLLAAAWTTSGTLASWISLEPAHIMALRLMWINMFLIAFTFVPFHAMRMRDEAAVYSAFSLARSSGQIVLRIVLVIVLRLGVTGIYAADVMLTSALLPLMAPWYKSLIRWQFSLTELKETLRFGLPRLPHGLASQTLDSNPKLMLAKHALPEAVGVYQNGVALGTGVAFFKNALETAFAPFYYATASAPDARVVFAKMATYGAAVIVLLVAGTTAVSRDTILVMLTPAYLPALPVLPLVATAFGLQGIYQLTSIGLNLTSRTELYSIATITAAGVSLAAGALLIPRFGVVGAATTVLVSYATQASIAFALAQRVYPVRYEAGRLARLVVAGAAAACAALWLVPPMPPIAGLLVRGSVTVVVYLACLAASGFLRATERAFLAEMWTRARAWRGRMEPVSRAD